MKVNEIMTRHPEVIRPDAPLVEAAVKMLALDVGMLPVCEGDRLVGILTDRDIVLHAVTRGGVRTTPVRIAMSPGAVCCPEHWEIEQAAELMEENQVRRLPVVNDEGRLTGVLSLGDLAVRTGDLELAGRVLERVSQPVPNHERTRSER